MQQVKIPTGYNSCQTALHTCLDNSHNIRFNWLNNKLTFYATLFFNHLEITIVQVGSLEPLVVTARVCLATPAFANIPGMNDSCQKRCLSYPPDCPEVNSKGIRYI